MLRQFLLAAALSIWVLAAPAQTINPGSSITNPGGPMVTHNISDDGYVHVPLQFGFPYHGKLFTNSWMFDNGIVAFMDPIGTQANQYWNSEQFSQGMQPRFSYMIAPLWSDLRPVASTTYTTQGNQQSMTYTWTNLAEYYNPTNLNTFSLQIKPSGFIGIDYTNINISQSNVSVGLTGNLEQGQYVQHFWASAGTNIGLESIPNWNVTDTGVDQCVVDPLSSPTCSGYNDAMCAADPLYSSTCPGYAAAYFDQQCSIDTLYDPACPGYATAYYDYQCSVNALYHTGCPGYAAAYFDQQCANDALYNNQCPGYSTAYAKKYILVAEPTTEAAAAAETETVVVAQSTATETNEVTATAAATESAAAPVVSTSPATSATAPVSLVAAPASPAAAPAENKTETAAAGAASESKSRPASTRQALAQRRLAAATAAAAESAKNNPAAVSEQMDSAASMEQQVELQNVVLGAMGFVAGFDAYGRVTLPDAAGYRPFEIYSGQRNVDTPAARGLLGRSDRIHQDMVDSQYKK